LLIHESWECELIQYQLDPTPGFWNFTCLVADNDGDRTYSEILLQIHRVSSTTITILGPLLGFIYLIVSRKKKKKV
ncbi:MAG: hypothetical protein ACFFAE_09590, partial [Candidatus Hodarchaeota archaeon]